MGYHAWKANSIGRSSKVVREFLEQQYSPENVDTEDKCIKLTARALLEVVQSSGKNLELAIMRTRKNADGKVVPEDMQILSQEQTDELVKKIEVERLEEQEKKKK